MKKQVTIIPWAKPDFWGNEIQYVTQALKSNWISGGKYLDELERYFTNLFDRKHALSVSNGTTAIQLAYLGLGLKPGDEVIVPGFAFMAAANIALHMGLKPIFAEIDPETWCLDSKKLTQYISKKTKAIVPVHTYGNVCNMNPIMKIARSHNIPVIEDCAESLFSKYNNKLCGTFGQISTFSFQATKTITTGEGGLVVTNSDSLSRTMKLYRSHGMDRSKKYYWHELPGHNFRLTNFQAAFGLGQLEKIKIIKAQRKRVYNLYKSLLGNVDGVKLQKIEKNVTPVIWAVALKLNTKFFSQGRDKIIEQLKKSGIETRPGFYASSLLKIYHKHSLPVSEDVSRNVISLPTFPTLKNDDVEYMCNELLKLRR